MVEGSTGTAEVQGSFDIEALLQGQLCISDVKLTKLEVTGLPVQLLQVLIPLLNTQIVADLTTYNPMYLVSLSMDRSLILRNQQASYFANMHVTASSLLVYDTSQLYSSTFLQ